MKYQKFDYPECYQTDHVQVLDIETLSPAIEDGSFPPWPLHEPVCASVLSQKKFGDDYTFGIETIDFANERAGLHRLFELLDPGATLVTWNGRGFDVPVLQLAASRQLLFEDNALRIAWMAPRWAITHADLAELYGRFGGAGRPSLANVCKALGIDAKTQGSGDSVAAMIADGREQQVFRYCEEDVAITRHGPAAATARSRSVRPHATGPSSAVRSLGHYVHLPEFCEAIGVASKPMPSKDISLAVRHGAWDYVETQVVADVCTIAQGAWRYFLATGSGSGFPDAGDEAVVTALANRFSADAWLAKLARPEQLTA